MSEAVKAPAEKRNRKAPTDDEIRALIKSEIASSEGALGTELSKQRAQNIDYYLGRPFGNEQDGRSAVVSTDVMDTIEWIMPSLIRMFASGETTVQFQPVGPEDVKTAEQATDYVNHIWNQDNNGFLVYYTWFKDALITKNGQIKIWWDDTPSYKRESYYGLDDQSFAVIAADETVKVSEHTEYEGTIPTVTADPQSGLPVFGSQPAKLHDLVIQREDVENCGRVCIENVAPENFIISRDAKNIPDARLVGDRKLVTISDLIEEGFDRKLVEECGNDDVDEYGDNEEQFARNTVETDLAGSAGMNPGMARTWRTECYLRLDTDGDGIAEMRKIVTGGTGHIILSNEAWDAPRPYASLTPIIMPHRFYGLALADVTRDIQLIKSTIERQYLDGLYLQNQPRLQVVEDDIVDQSELLLSRPGGIVRVKNQGAIEPITQAFDGSQALSGLQYLDQLRENRTGVSQQTQGLSSTTLHDTAKGQQMLMSAAQGKVELIARVFAETGIRDAFRLILQLVCRYQDRKRIVRLRNTWVPMDPREWKSEMDMTVSVGLGTGDKQQQLQNYMMIGQLQQQAFPLGFVKPENFMETAEGMLNAMGIKGVERFFTLPPPADPNNKPPDPAMAKVQADAQIAQQRLQSETQLEQQKQHGDMMLEQAKMQRETQVDTHRNQLEAQVDQARVSANMQLEQIKLQANRELEIMLAQMRNAADIEIARINALHQAAADAYAAEATGIKAGATSTQGS